MEVFGMVVFVAFIALLVRSLFKKPDGKKLQKFVDNWEWVEPRNRPLFDDTEEYFINKRRHQL